MVGQVVAGEQQGPAGVAVEVGDGDRDELAVAGEGGRGRGAAQQRPPGRVDERGRDEDGRVVAGGGSLDERGARRRVTGDEAPDQLVGGARVHAEKGRAAG